MEGYPHPSPVLRELMQPDDLYIKVKYFSTRTPLWFIALWLYFSSVRRPCCSFSSLLQRGTTTIPWLFGISKYVAKQFTQKGRFLQHLQEEHVKPHY